MDTKNLRMMNKFKFTLKYIVLATFVSLTSCLSDELPNVGDLPDITGPTPFYSVTDLTTSEFDCDDVELWASYEFNFQAGSNLAVNGIYYDWTISPSEGVALINKDLPILEQQIDAQLASVITIEDQIAKLEFKIPCETNPAKVAAMEAEIAALEIKLAAAEAALSDETLQNVADLEEQIANLPPATLKDPELIFSFPGPGEYTVSLKVTDNLGKFDTVEKSFTVNQAIPTIPIPEIGEPSFEPGTLFDGTGDGRDSWRVPSNTAWSPLGGGTTVIQISTDSNPDAAPNFPHGVKAAKLPAGGDRVLYQEIEVTPGATYVLTYFSEYAMDNFGELNVSILTPNTSSYAESKLKANIIASRKDSNVGRAKYIFKKHAITFEAGENETVIIYGTNSGDEVRLDVFEISVK